MVDRGAGGRGNRRWFRGGRARHGAASGRKARLAAVGYVDGCRDRAECGREPERDAYPDRGADPDPEPERDDGRARPDSGRRGISDRAAADARRRTGSVASPIRFRS
jgi:hypothetical protein